MQQHLLLQTKLQILPTRPESVSRPRLIERLNGSLTMRGAFSLALTLVSAPAGFGKTTLVSGWLETCDCPSTWLFLDEEDDDLVLFLTYLLAAIETIFPGGADETLALFRAVVRLRLPFPAPRDIIPDIGWHCLSLPQPHQPGASRSATECVHPLGCTKHYTDGGPS